MSRSQPRTSATTSASAVLHASRGGSKGAPFRAASVPPTDVKDHPIPPPVKVKKGTASIREKSHHPPSKASPKHREDSAKVPAVTAKVGKGHKRKGKSPQGTIPPGVGLVTTILSGMPVTCTTVTTTTCMPPALPPALPPAPPLPQRHSAASSPRISHPRLPETVWCLPPPQQTLAPRPAPAASLTQPTPTAPPSVPQRAQPVPLCQTSAASPVGSRPRLQVTSWTVDTPLEAPPPALSQPAVGRLSCCRMECGSASM
ncbi:hypothetical protein NDU88_004955 [Pleurodeles waltl]|uniref:Uncharacterized protein n=1 Tax=Pleurodeles waltl TaxID=8319 RepID=A0AAV7QHJ8_PLEWA|nr:hypothetical protein NDU88_004955 [Pleurodeles waltl]